jgi:hypothetical protein
MIRIDKTKSSVEIEPGKKAEELSVIYASGIVNPNGPTLMVYYSDTNKQSKCGNLYQVIFHPISDSIKLVGETEWNAQLAEVQGITLNSDIFDSSFPTLFLKGSVIGQSLFESLLINYMKSIEDSKRIYRLLKKYEGNPFERVSAEINGAVQSLIRDKESKSSSIFKKFGKGLSNGEINNKKFAQILMNKNNVQKEIQALIAAYNGSIENVIPTKLVQLDFNAFLNVFAHVSAACNLSF